MMPAVFRFEDRPFDPFGATTPREARAWNGSPAREVTSIRSGETRGIIFYAFRRVGL